MNKERVAAFTDAIVAIAATIMVLELKTPVTSHLADLVEKWPIFLAYLISFSLIYLSWQSHEDVFEHLSFLSRKTFVWNGIWILFVTFIPFVTAWVGEFPSSRLPVFLYVLVNYLWNLSAAGVIAAAKREGALETGVVFLENYSRLFVHAYFLIGLVLAFFFPLIALAWLLILILVSFYQIYKEG